MTWGYRAQVVCDGKSRSLRLQPSGAAAAAAAATAAVPAKPSAAHRASGAATAAAATVNRTPARRLSLLLASKRASAAKAPPSRRATKPVRQLKGGRMVYCPLYCHTGECPRRGRRCPHRHDPTKRAVCERWLRGGCALGKGCPLQHQRRPELMPTCRHQLKASGVAVAGFASAPLRAFWLHACRLCACGRKFSCRMVFNAAL